MEGVKLYFVRLFLCDKCRQKLERTFPKDAVVLQGEPPPKRECELCPLLDSISMTYLKIGKREELERTH